MQLLLPIQWLTEGQVRFLEQTRLPGEELWLTTADYRQIADAISRLAIRGAPLIGIAAAYGLALAALESATSPSPGGSGFRLTGAGRRGQDAHDLRANVRQAAQTLRATRPTAVNLAWALDRMLTVLDDAADDTAARQALVQEAQRIHEEDIEGNKRLGANGAALLPAGGAVLTHCNAGSLATGGYGTALGVIRAAWERGKLRQVIATETRPLLQGARLTAWELKQDGIPFTLIADSAAGSAMRRGLVSAVVTGADRIATNGDAANKIGTYQLAVLAHENGIPFFIAAPTSTIDLSLAGGEEIPIEERSPEEVTSFRGQPIAPDGTAAANPAFDVTPNRYVSAIITENGVARAPYEAGLRAVCRTEVPARG